MRPKNLGGKIIAILHLLLKPRSRLGNAIPLAVFLLFNFLSILTHAQIQPTCNPEMLLYKSPFSPDSEKCQDFSSAPLDLRKTRNEADGVLFNYSLIGRIQHRQAIENFGRNSTKRENDRALEVANEARRYAIDFLTGKRPKTAWSRETKALVERVLAIQFRISKMSDGDCYDHGDAGYPQASYSPFDHSIGICNSLAKTNSDGIFATIAHEIGHAVSSCNMKRPLIKYQTMSTEDLACLLGNQRINSLSENELIQETKELITSYREITTGLDLDTQRTDQFEKCGLAKRVKDSALPAGIMAFKSFDDCAFKKFSNDYFRYVAKFSFNLDDLPPKLSPDLQNVADNFMRENPQSCYRKSEEHFADVFSAQLVALRHAKIFSDQPRKASERAYQLSVFDLAAGYCLNALEGRNLSNPHLYPSARERVLTYFIPPYTQRVLNCRLAPGEICEIPTDPSSYSTPASVAPPAQKTRRTQ